MREALEPIIAKIWWHCQETGIRRRSWRARFRAPDMHRAATQEARAAANGAWQRLGYRPGAHGSLLESSGRTHPHPSSAVSASSIFRATACGAPCSRHQIRNSFGVACGALRGRGLRSSARANKGDIPFIGLGRGDLLQVRNRDSDFPPGARFVTGFHIIRGVGPSQLLWQSLTSRDRASSATAPRLPDADRRRLPDSRSRDLPVPAQGTSAHAMVSDHAGPPGRSR
jgi:hypothetical protein